MRSQYLFGWSALSAITVVMGGPATTMWIMSFSNQRRSSTDTFALTSQSQQNISKHEMNNEIYHEESDRFSATNSIEIDKKTLHHHYVSDNKKQSKRNSKSIKINPIYNPDILSYDEIVFVEKMLNDIPKEQKHRGNVQTLFEKIILEASAVVAVQIVFGAPVVANIVTSLFQSKISLFKNVASIFTKRGSAPAIALTWKAIQRQLSKNPWWQRFMGEQFQHISEEGLQVLMTRGGRMSLARAKPSFWERVKSIPKTIRAVYRSRSEYCVVSEYTYYIGIDDEPIQVE